MNLSLKKNFLLSVFLVAMQGSFAQSQPAFVWPNGKQVAISLTFDDARESQVETGTALLDKFNVKGTFYVVPASVERKLTGWKQAVANGHEIGNHSVKHPCSGNFPWAREKALENYSVEQMREELIEANRQIQNLLGIQCSVFAYPCG